MTSSYIEQGQERAPQYTHEEFLATLYDRIADSWKSGQMAEVIEEIPECYVDNWDSHESLPGRIAHFRAHIEKAMLLENEKFNFGVALVDCARSSYDRGKTHRLQFGALPRSNSPAYRDFTPTKKLKLLVSGRHYGRGEFYSEVMDGKLKIDCWADEQEFGGPQIGSWLQERLLADEGIAGCVGLAARTIDRAFY